MDDSPRRAAYPGRWLRRPQRGARSAGAVRRLIALAACLSGSAHADPGPEWLPNLRLGTAYVDNPFFDPLDPALVERTDIPATAGHTARLDVGGGLRGRWQAPAGHRVEWDAFGRLSAWQGAAQTEGFDAGLWSGWYHPLVPTVEGRFEAMVGAAAINAFPDDDAWWLQFRLGAQWHPGHGDHRLDGRIAYGLRTLPDRIVDFDSSATGQRYHQIRGRVRLHSSLGERVELESRYSFGLSRPWVRSVDHDTHALSVDLSKGFGSSYVGARVSGWMRDFEDRDDGARLDRGLALHGRIGHRPWRGVEVSLRYRFLRSFSDDPYGRYAQHIAGLVFDTWFEPRRQPSETTRLGPAAFPTTDGWHFRLHAPGAASVALTGDFNEWSKDSHALSGPDRWGWWSITTRLPPGRTSYMFVLDGEYFVRPEGAPHYAQDGFGGEVGVIYVVAAASEAQKP